MPGREEKTCQRDLRQFHHEGAAGTLPCEYKNICFVGLSSRLPPFSPGFSSKLFDYPIIATIAQKKILLSSSADRTRRILSLYTDIE